MSFSLESPSIGNYCMEPGLVGQNYLKITLRLDYYGYT